MKLNISGRSGVAATVAFVAAWAPFVACSSSSGGPAGGDGGSSSSSGATGSTSSSGSSSSGGSGSTSSSSGSSTSSGGSTSSSSGGSSSSTSSGSTSSSGGMAEAGTDGTVADSSVADVVAADVALTDAGAYTRTGWTAVGTPATPTMRIPMTTENLMANNAFDGSLGTRWGTGLYENVAGQLPETFTVDMKQPIRFSKITLQPGTADQQDVPGSMDVAVSVDGTNFTTILMGHVGVATLDTVTFAAQTAQFIRLTNTKATTLNGGNHWWAIAEFNVYP